MRSWKPPRRGPRHNGFISGMSVFLTHTSESPAQWRVCEADDEFELVVLVVKENEKKELAGWRKLADGQRCRFAGARTKHQATEDL